MATFKKEDLPFFLYNFGTVMKMTETKTEIFNENLEAHDNGAAIWNENETQYIKDGDLYEQSNSKGPYHNRGRVYLSDLKGWVFGVIMATGHQR